MMTIYDWREMREERARERMIKRLKPPKRLTETERKLQVLETLRDWGVITEDEYLERKGELAPVCLPAQTSW